MSWTWTILEPVLPPVSAGRFCNSAPSGKRWLNCRSTCLRASGPDAGDQPRMGPSRKLAQSVRFVLSGIRAGKQRIQFCGEWSHEVALWPTEWVRTIQSHGLRSHEGKKMPSLVGEHPAGVWGGGQLDAERANNSKGWSVVMLNFILRLAFFQETPPLSSLSWVAGLWFCLPPTPRHSPHPKVTSVCPTRLGTRRCGLFQFRVFRTTLMLTARCITGIVLDLLGVGLCYAVTRIWLNPLLSLWGSALQYNPSRTFPSSVIVKITIWQCLWQVTFFEHLSCARNHAKCFMGTTSLYPHNHPIKYLLTRWGLQRSNNFMAIKLISSEVGLCTQISLPQNLRSSHCDRPNNENLTFTKDFMRCHGRGFISHTTWGKLHKSSFYRALFPKVPPKQTTPSSLYALLGETKAWSLGVLTLPPAWHSTTRSQGSPPWCARSELSCPFQRKGISLYSGKTQISSLEQRWHFLSLLFYKFLFF